MAALCGMPTTQYSARSARLSVRLSKWGVQRWQVVKVIWHKEQRCRRRMVQCYLTGDGNMSSHEGTLAPPGEYDWICASFSSLKPTTQTANRSLKLSLHCSRQKVPIIYNGRPYPPELPPQMADLDAHVTHALGPCEPTTQTAPRSLQLCLHKWPRSVRILHNCLPVSPLKIAPSHVGIWTSCNMWFIGPTRVWNPNGNLIASAVFAWLTSVTDWQGDRQTMLLGAVQCGIIMRNYVGYSKATHSFHVSTNNFATIKSLSERFKHLIKYLV